MDKEDFTIVMHALITPRFVQLLQCILCGAAVEDGKNIFIQNVAAYFLTVTRSPGHVIFILQGATLASISLLGQDKVLVCHHLIYDRKGLYKYFKDCFFQS